MYPYGDFYKSFWFNPYKAFDGGSDPDIISILWFITILGGNYWSNSLVSTSLSLTNSLQMCYRKGPSFLAYPWALWNSSIQTTTIICWAFNGYGETNFNLRPPPRGFFVNIKVTSLPSWQFTRSTRGRIISTGWILKMVSTKTESTSSI